MKQWKKTALKCEEWRPKVVKNEPKWWLRVKLALALSKTSAKSNIHGRPPYTCQSQHNGNPDRPTHVFVSN